MGMSKLLENTQEVKAYEEVKNQSFQFSTVLNLINAANKNGYIPNQFSKDNLFKADLINYIYDGTLPQDGFGEHHTEYKNLVQILSNNLFNNQISVHRGTYSPDAGTYEETYEKSGLDNFSGKIYLHKVRQTALDKQLDKFNNSKGKGGIHTPVFIQGR